MSDHSPPGRYKTIVADPPWPYEGTLWRSTTGAHYEQMSLEEIVALPVGDLSSSDAHLYLWSPLPLMADAYQVVRAWGFRATTLLTWCKPGVGLGGGFRGNTEHLIVARRGWSFVNPTCDLCGGRARGARKCDCTTPVWRVNGVLFEEGALEERPFQGVADGTWYAAPRSGHSVKPDLFLDLIERMSPGPYLEMFARRARFGWDYWGDQSLGTATLTA